MLRFDRSGKFVILQVSDPQDLHNTRKLMLKMLDKAYFRVQPDLVIFTGDNVLGNHLRDAAIGNRKVVKTDEGEYKRLKKTLDNLIMPVVKRHIPFTFIYGNHDDMNSVSKDEQNKIYLSYPGCHGPENRGEGMEAGTFNVPIMSHDGKKIAFNLWCFDSARQVDGHGYEAVTQQCLDWYREKSTKLKEENGGTPVPSLIFQHIPMIEQKKLVENCEAYSIGAHKFGSDFVRLNPKLAKGNLGEPISAVSEDFGEEKAIKECGDVLAVVTGHDHSNSFDGTVDGIRYVQTAGASMRCYGTRDRGVRVFVLDENSGTFETKTLTYADLCGTGLLAELAYICSADGEQKKLAALGIATAVTAGITAAVTGKIIRRK